jgi:hypothetical protein
MKSLLRVSLMCYLSLWCSHSHSMWWRVVYSDPYEVTAVPLTCYWTLWCDPWPCGWWRVVYSTPDPSVDEGCTWPLGTVLLSPCCGVVPCCLGVVAWLTEDAVVEVKGVCRFEDICRLVGLCVYTRVDLAVLSKSEAVNISISNRNLVKQNTV